MFQGQFMIFLVNHPLIFFVVTLVVLWIFAHIGAFFRQRQHPAPRRYWPRSPDTPELGL